MSQSSIESATVRGRLVRPLTRSVRPLSLAAQLETTRHSCLAPAGGPPVKQLECGKRMVANLGYGMFGMFFLHPFAARYSHWMDTCIVMASSVAFKSWLVSV